MNADKSKNTSPQTAAVLTSIAFSLSNFRGPLIQAMVDAGVKVFALAPDYDADTRAAVLRLGAIPIDVSLDRTGLHPLRDLLDSISLYRTLRRLKPDLMFSYFIKPVIYGSIAAKFAGVRHRYALVAGLGYIFATDGSADDFKRRILRLVASGLYRVAFAACDRVFFQNSDDVREFVNGRILPADKVRLLEGTGVDLQAYPATPPLASPPTFLLMGRLLREKGIVEFANAAKAVRSVYPATRFVLLGGLDPNPGGLSKVEVEQMAIECGMEWLGHVNDVKPYIAACSVYVLPSYYREGKPRSTQEAMAFGRAIITTDAPGCRDTVIPDVNGFLVPVRDPGALAQAMFRFLEKPELIQRMGRESRRLAEERYDVHQINRAILGEFGIGQSSPSIAKSLP
ncbi:MAG: glycosyltransferase family 4 protein [Pseudomonadota bacterium]